MVSLDSNKTLRHRLTHQHKARDARLHLTASCVWAGLLPALTIEGCAMVYMKQIHTLHMSRSLAGIQQPDRACPSPERFLYDSFLVSFMPYLPQRNHRLARWSCLARERPLKVTDSRELPSAWLDTVDFSSNHAATFLCVLFFFVIINSSVPNRWAHGHL